MLDCATSPHEDVGTSRSNGSPFSAQQKESECVSFVSALFDLFFVFSDLRRTTYHDVWGVLYVCMYVYIYICMYMSIHVYVSVGSQTCNGAITFLNPSCCANDEPQTVS